MIDTTSNANWILPYLWAMGYDAGNYSNNTVGPVFNAMASSGIFIFDGHGGWGTPYLNCYGTFLCPVLTEEKAALSNHRAMTKKTATGDRIRNINLSGCDLMILSACYSGLDTEAYDNLVDQALYNYARCVIGWSDKIGVSESNHWLSEFLESAGNGNNIEAAAAAARHSTSIVYGENSAMIAAFYAGTSPLESLIIG